MNATNYIPLLVVVTEELEGQKVQPLQSNYILQYTHSNDYK